MTDKPYIVKEFTVNCEVSFDHTDGPRTFRWTSGALQKKENNMSAHLYTDYYVTTEYTPIKTFFGKIDDYEYSKTKYHIERRNLRTLEVERVATFFGPGATHHAEYLNRKVAKNRHEREQALLNAGKPSYAEAYEVVFGHEAPQGFGKIKAAPTPLY